MKTLIGTLAVVALLLAAPLVFGDPGTSPASLYETSKAAASSTVTPAPAPVVPPAIPADWTNALTGLIVGGVPVLVMLIKKLLPATAHNYIPLVATMLAPVVSFLAGKAVDHSISPLWAALLGLTSVGLRELLTHLTRAVTEKL